MITKRNSKRPNGESPEKIITSTKTVFKKEKNHI